MTGKRLRSIRLSLGLTQAQFGERVRLHGNSIARMERDEVAIVAPIELLIELVAKEAGVDIAPHTRAGRRVAAPEAAGRARAGHPPGKGRSRQG